MALAELLDAMAKPSQFSVNSWISDTDKRTAMYVRVGTIYINRRFVKAVTLASMAVEPSSQRKGRCTEFIQSMINYAASNESKIELILIENIVAPEMLALLKNKKFTLPDGTSVSFTYSQHGEDVDPTKPLPKYNLCAYARVRN